MNKLMPVLWYVIVICMAWKAGLEPLEAGVFAISLLAYEVWTVIANRKEIIKLLQRFDDKWVS